MAVHSNLSQGYSFSEIAQRAALGAYTYKIGQCSLSYCAKQVDIDSYIAIDKNINERIFDLFAYFDYGMNVFQAVPIIGPAVGSPLKITAGAIVTVVGGLFALLGGLAYLLSGCHGSVGNFAGMCFALALLEGVSPIAKAVGNIATLGLYQLFAGDGINFLKACRGREPHNPLFGDLQPAVNP